MFVELTHGQVRSKLDFIQAYCEAKNAADGSAVDSNANVSSKNIATLEAELYKDFNIQINREMMTDRITSLYGKSYAMEYLRQIKDHEIYVHDESSLKPYCVSVTMYPLLTDGLIGLGGESKAPKHLESFCGSFVNFVFAVSSQFAGAIATVEFLLYFDYFARKEYGDDYVNTHTKEINNHLQHVVYAINQPAAARGYQSVFWNISLYDQYYFESLFGDFVFPDKDCTRPSWDSLKKLQGHWLEWFNEERSKSLLTFPVVTVACLTEDSKPKDTEFVEMCANNISHGGSFFVYMSDSADSLASCCRLRNEFTDNTFSYSLGAGGVSTGSIKVITLNMNRIVQTRGLEAIPDIIDDVHKYHHAFRTIIQDYLKAGMLTAYDAGFISLDKQFNTIGINGLLEAAEHVLNCKISDAYPEYEQFVNDVLKVIYDKNKDIKKSLGFMVNTEFVPAENLGVKNSKWDKQDGLNVSRDCYNSYFYPVEDESVGIIEKFLLHGKDFVKYLDGGSALHLNMSEMLTVDSAISLFHLAASTGCNYWCTNVMSTVCNDCGFINKSTEHFCIKCKSQNIDHATRIIGYLKRISSFSTPRQIEADHRYYHHE